MPQKRRIKKKFRWFRRLKSRFLAWFAHQSEIRTQKRKSKKRRRKHKLQPQSLSLKARLQRRLRFFKSKPSSRHRQKKSWLRRLRWKWQRSLHNFVQSNQKFFKSQKKKKRRRKRKQYAVYVMSNQQKID